MAERRPIVSLDGTIRYGMSEEQKRLIEFYGLDAEKAYVVRDDSKNTLVRIHDKYYLLEKEGKTNG